MHIDIWIDFNCPFCYLGKKRFEQALDKFKYKDVVSVTYKTYLIRPYFDNNQGLNSHEVLAKHKDISLEEAKNIHTNIAKTAFDDGLLYDFEKMIPASTIQAHKISKLFSDTTHQKNFIDDIYQAYFSKGEDISQLATLISYGTKHGLDQTIIESTFMSNDLEAIETDVNMATRLGIKGVPFFVVNQQFGLAGAQDLYVFLEMLEEVYYDSQPKGKTDTEYCVGEHCERKKT